MQRPNRKPSNLPSKTKQQRRGSRIIASFDFCFGERSEIGNERVSHFKLCFVPGTGFNRNIGIHAEQHNAIPAYQRKHSQNDFAVHCHITPRTTNIYKKSRHGVRAPSYDAPLLQSNVSKKCVSKSPALELVARVVVSSCLRRITHTLKPSQWPEAILVSL